MDFGSPTLSPSNGFYYYYYLFFSFLNSYDGGPQSLTENTLPHTDLRLDFPGVSCFAHCPLYYREIAGGVPNPHMVTGNLQISTLTILPCCVRRTCAFNGLNGSRHFVFDLSRLFQKLYVSFFFFSKKINFQ